MADVALVFHILDDRDQNARISLPQKNTVNIGQGISRNEALDFSIVIRQHDDRDISSDRRNLARQLRRVHSAHGQVGDDQVETGLRARQFKRLHSV